MTDETSIPSPAPWGLVSAVAQRFEEMYGRVAFIGVLEEFPVEVLERIIRIFDKEEKVHGIKRKLLLQRIASAVGAGYPGGCVNELITYAGVNGSGFGEAPVIALYHYRNMGWVPASSGTAPDTRDLALMTVSWEVVHILASDRSPILAGKPTAGVIPVEPLFESEIESVRNGTIRLLSDERLVRLIWERPNDADQIIEAFSDRGDVGYETLVRILDSASPALSEGVL